MNDRDVRGPMDARRPAFWLLALAALLASACGSAACEDRDGDGFGTHCESGPDCDDDDASLAASCTAVDCEQVPTGAGCPCQGTAVRSCFSGPEGADAHGACRAGKRYCSAGTWSICDGEVPPATERCNDLDDDCDGRVDEGVLSPCGGCNALCYGGVWGGPAAPFAANAPLVVSPQGALTLAYGQVEQHNVWVANTDERTLSRVDGRALQERARYQMPGSPHRIAVDYRGAALVVSESEQGWFLTKVAGATEDCSTGPTSLGPTDVKDFGQDGCSLWTVQIGAPGAAPLGLAVDGTRGLDQPASANAWVASAAPAGVRMYFGDTGDAGPILELPEGARPVDGAFDRSGGLWVADRTGFLHRFTYGPEGYRRKTVVVRDPCYELSALAIDMDGRVFVSTFACESVLRFDPVADRFDSATAPGLLSTRGLVGLNDALYVVHTAAALSRVQTVPLRFLETTALTAPMGVPQESVGLAADDEGALWVTSRAGGEGGMGLLSRVDPDSMAVSGQLTVGLGPRAVGDFTGTRLLGTSAPQGTAQHLFYGCGAEVDTRWGAIHARYTVGADGEVEFLVRQASSEERLTDEPWQSVGTLPIDDGELGLTDLPSGGVLAVRMVLTAGAHIGAPEVRQVGVQWACPGLE